MMQALESVLLDVLETTCETLAFMFPVPPPDQGTDEPATGVRVRFEGPISGCLALAAPDGMLSSLAANMLAVDPSDVTDEQRLDALKELCNVVCGNLLPRLVGPVPVFHVGTPEREPDAVAHDAEALTACTWLEEGWVQATLTVEGGLHPIETLRRESNISSDDERERYDFGPDRR